MSTEKPTRYRRTKADITEDIRKAAVDQVMKRGFSLSLVTEIIKKAKIEPPVFYHRYKDLNEFYSEFVKGYDYWFFRYCGQGDEEQRQSQAAVHCLDGWFAGIPEGKVGDAGTASVGNSRGKRYDQKDCHPA